MKHLIQFGTPEEIAARVVTAEVNRDGIFEVKLLTDPIFVEKQGTMTGGNDKVVKYLQLEYLSTGKRGNKYIWNKIGIASNLLYVLTVQLKQETYDNATTNHDQSKKDPVAVQALADIGTILESFSIE